MYRENVIEHVPLFKEPHIEIVTLKSNSSSVETILHNSPNCLVLKDMKGKRGYRVGSKEIHIILLCR
jgi:hypothetical protein